MALSQMFSGSRKNFQSARERIRRGERSMAEGEGPFEFAIVFVVVIGGSGLRLWAGKGNQMKFGEEVQTPTG